MQEFLQECLALGSCLTLYVYLLQCLNSEQTVKNEMKVLLILSTWLEHVYPRCACPLLLQCAAPHEAQSPGVREGQTAFQGEWHVLGKDPELAELIL